MKDLSKLRDEIPEKYPFMKDVYLECNNGWFPLILSACAFLDVYWEDDFKVLQVKEKFGQLRFYTTSNDIIYKYLHKIEDISACICEMCGVISDEHLTRQMGNYWIKSICVDCHTDWKNKYND